MAEIAKREAGYMENNKRGGETENGKTENGRDGRDNHGKSPME